ncbi:hypothetical protein OAV06_04630 [Acidimicrobiia bacterium]|nr:hypothetical protein [Acidimicrobiia bacterium]
MNDKCKIEGKTNGTIMLGDFLACDGQANWNPDTKTGQLFLAISHIHGDHFNETKVNKTMAYPNKIEPIMSEGTRDLLDVGTNLNLRDEANHVLKFGKETVLKASEKSDVQLKITLKDSKHILGSSQIQVEEPSGRRYGYSGDFGEGITDFIDVDTLVLDSTNGTREDFVNWTVDDAIVRLADEISIAIKAKQKVAIIGAPGLLQETVSRIKGVFDNVNIGTDEFYENKDISLIKKYSEVYEKYGFSQPKINSSYEADFFGDIETKALFQFGSIDVYLAHNKKDIGFGELENFKGTVFNLKNFYRHNDKPLVKRNNTDIWDVSLTSHALGETILDYVDNVKPELVITDSSRNERCADSLAKKIKNKLNIDAIPSLEISQ